MNSIIIYRYYHYYYRMLKNKCTHEDENMYEEQ